MRRDESEARAREQEAERTKRDDDAAERLRLLRGGSPNLEDHAHAVRDESKRKRGEDDKSMPHSGYEKRQRHFRRGDDAQEVSRHVSREAQEANVTAEPLDKISNMRFRDAAGRHPDARQPWYSTATSNDKNPGTGRDVWGNEDAGRHARNQKRLDASDPLLAIKRGVKQLKDVEKQKSEWRREREKDLYEVEDLARKERHRRRKEERRKHRSEKDRSHRSSRDHHEDDRRDRPEHSRSERT